MEKLQMTAITSTVRRDVIYYVNYGKGSQRDFMQHAVFFVKPVGYSMT